MWDGEKTLRVPKAKIYDNLPSCRNTDSLRRAAALAKTGEKCFGFVERERERERGLSFPKHVFFPDSLFLDLN